MFSRAIDQKISVEQSNSRFRSALSNNHFLSAAAFVLVIKESARVSQVSSALSYEHQHLGYFRTGTSGRWDTNRWRRRLR